MLIISNGMGNYMNGRLFEHGLYYFGFESFDHYRGIIFIAIIVFMKKHQEFEKIPAMVK